MFSLKRRKCNSPLCFCIGVSFYSLNNKNKFITQEEIGKATINRNIEGIDIAKEKVSNIAEKIRYSNQDIEQE